jgi:hypothetical protein
MKKPAANSRNKGASFERQIPTALFLETGITFKRNLEQSREAAHGDLIADDPAWPFSCELKRYAKGVTCLAAWKDQSVKAADACGKLPCVIFKFDNAPIRVAVPLTALFWNVEGWAEIDFPTFCMLARDLMAGEAAANAV